MTLEAMCSSQQYYELCNDQFSKSTEPAIVAENNIGADAPQSAGLEASARRFNGFPAQCLQPEYKRKKKPGLLFFPEIHLKAGQHAPVHDERAFTLEGLITTVVYNPIS